MAVNIYGFTVYGPFQGVLACLKIDTKCVGLQLLVKNLHYHLVTYNLAVSVLLKCLFADDFNNLRGLA